MISAPPVRARGLTLSTTWSPSLIPTPITLGGSPSPLHVEAGVGVGSQAADVGNQDVDVGAVIGQRMATLTVDPSSITTNMLLTSIPTFGGVLVLAAMGAGGDSGLDYMPRKGISRNPQEHRSPWTLSNNRSKEFQGKSKPSCMRNSGRATSRVSGQQSPAFWHLLV